MIVGKINLAQLKHVFQEKKGTSGIIKCIVIPIKENHLFEGKDGNIYLDLVAFELKDQKDNSHLVKQSLPKEIREKMSKEDLEKQPILGNLNVNQNTNSGNANANNGETLSEEDDLPF